MESIDVKLINLGKELGLAGETLLEFIKDREQMAREERAAIREDRKQELELKKLEENILDKQIALEQAKKENVSQSGDTSSGHHSLTKIPKLPHFDESRDNMDAYLERFERYASSQRWQTDCWAINLGALLQGKALEVYSRLAPDEAANYSTLKDALLRRYQMSADDFRKKFYKATPETGESAGQFMARLEHYFERWLDLTETDKSFEGLKDLIIRQQFLEQVSPGLAVFLRERTLKTTREMTDAAQIYISAHGGHFKGPRTDNKVMTPNKSEKKSEAFQKGKQSNRKIIGPCYLCDQMGHLAKHCKLNSKPKPQKGGSFVHMGSKSNNPKKSSGKAKSQANQEKDDDVNTNLSFECPTCSSSKGSEADETQFESGLFVMMSAAGMEQSRPSKKQRRKKAPEMCAACKGKLRSQMPVKDGIVNSQTVSVLRDTGCSCVVIRQSLVNRNQMTGKHKQCILIDGTVRWYPTARVHVDCPFFSGCVEALCMKSPVFDVILGNVQNALPPDAPNLNWGSASPDHDGSGKNSSETGMAVETRSQVAASQRKQTPLKVMSPIPEVSPDDIREAQLADPTLKKARELAESENDSKEGKRNTSFVMQDGLLHRVFQPNSVTDGNQIVQLVVPKPYRKSVMKLAHEGIMGGHQGVKKTTDKILLGFFWPGLQADVSRFCQSCDICQRTISKGRVPRVPLGKMPVIDVPFKRIAVDLVGPIQPITSRKNRYILTVVDCATRYPEAVALPNIETTTVAEALVQIFSRVGVPQEILSDQGTQFTSDLMRDIGRLLSIKQMTTSPYHPACNGLVERFNGTLKKILRRICADRPTDWDRYLAPILFAYREAPQASMGFSPFELLYGRTVRGPLLILKELWTGKQQNEELKSTYQYVVELKERLESTLEAAQHELRKSMARSSKYYNSKSRERKFQPGDQVLLLLPTEHNKLLVQWKGPFTVVHKLSDQDYRIDINGKLKTFHTNLLKRYISRDEDSEHEDSSTDSGNREVSAQATVVSEDDDDVEGSPVSEKPKSIGIQLPPLEATETIEDVSICLNLSRKQKTEVKSLLHDYREVITDLPGECKLGTHSIKLTTDEPVRQRPYPTPHARRNTIEEEVKKMLDMGVIEQSESPYSSPIVLVKKSDGTNRFCVDFRRLNRVTVFDAEPIPNSDEIFSSLSGCKYFSKVDLSKGYWQIPLCEDAKEKTAFRSPSGLYQFRRMPFGLVNAPATFSRVMRSLLRGMSNVHNYLDDILIHTRTWAEHLRVLREVFERLHAAGLTARPSKCHIGCRQIEFLGYIVREDKLQPMQDKVEKIRNAPQPETKKQMRSFIGMANYYRRFIPEFASIAAPLTDKTKGRQPDKLVWSEEDKKAFQQLKDCLSTAPVLCLADVAKPFIIRTDASAKGIGAVLLQEKEEGKCPVAYASRKLLPREQAYSAIERECLAIVWGIGKFQVYLDGREFILETDHKPLVYLNQSKSTNSRIMRWALALQPYRFHIEAIPGSENVGADFLSRAV